MQGGNIGSYFEVELMASVSYYIIGHKRKSKGSLKGFGGSCCGWNKAGLEF